jgi:hypothetical protein
VDELMARWATPTASSAGRDLREYMAQRAEVIAAHWSARASTDAERAYLERTVGAMADRWRSDEPIEVSAWQLPDWAGSSMPATARAVVHANGSLEVPEPGDVDGELIVLQSHLPRRATRPTPLR